MTLTIKSAAQVISERKERTRAETLANKKNLLRFIENGVLSSKYDVFVFGESDIKRHCQNDAPEGRLPKDVFLTIANAGYFIHTGVGKDGERVYAVVWDPNVTAATRIGTVTIDTLSPPYSYEVILSPLDPHNPDTLYVI